MTCMHDIFLPKLISILLKDYTFKVFFNFNSQLVTMIQLWHTIV